MELSDEKRYKSAKKKVRSIRDFYEHLFAYLIVNPIIIAIRYIVVPEFALQITDVNFEKWMDWNMLLIPFFWGIGLLAHAIIVFVPNLLSRWEAKKMKEFLNDDYQKHQQRWK